MPKRGELSNFNKTATTNTINMSAVFLQKKYEDDINKNEVPASIAPPNSRPQAPRIHGDPKVSTSPHIRPIPKSIKSFFL